jgi:hypothetical protein
METTHEPLDFDTWRFLQQKVAIDELLFCFTKLLSVTMMRNFDVMLG